MEITRKIEDLHGHKFAMEDSHFSPIPPKSFFPNDAEWIFTRDRILNQTFILVRGKGKKPEYWYIFWENKIYVYGLLTLISYNPDKDMRYEKGQR